MMLRIINQSFLEQLEQLSNNAYTKWYSKETPWLDEFFEHKKWSAQTKIEIPGNIELVKEGKESDSDLENAIQIYRSFKDKLTEVQASDARLWVYLCHETFWDYMKWRWPPNNEGTIRTRYFLDGSSSRSLSRNGIARLWWFAHLTYDGTRQNNYELTRILLQNQNIQHNLLERNFGRNKFILHTVLDFLKNHPEINGKEDYVKIGKALNRLGGVRLLDCMTEKQITEYLVLIFSRK